MQKLADPATHDQLIAGLRGAATIIAEHGDKFPTPSVTVTDHGYVTIHCPPFVADEATRLAAVDTLAELLNLGPAVENHKFYCAGNRTFDVFTALPENMVAAPVVRGAAAGAPSCSKTSAASRSTRSTKPSTSTTTKSASPATAPTASTSRASTRTGSSTAPRRAAGVATSWPPGTAPPATASAR